MSTGQKPAALLWFLFCIAMQPTMAATAQHFSSDIERIPSPVFDTAAENSVSALSKSHEFFAQTPESAWTAKQKEHYTKILQESGPWDVVVAPLAINQHGFDRTERSLFARLIAARIERNSSLKVADPGLIGFALGINDRYIASADVVKLATTLGAKHVVTGAMGHDRNGKYQFEIQSIELNNDKAEIIATAAATDLPFDDVQLPHTTFGPYADSIADGIVGKKNNRVRQESTVRTLNNAVPQSMGELLKAADESSLHEALYLEFIADLVPGPTSALREHLYERALVALELASPASKHYDLLKARAFDGLQRRPAAMQTLDDSNEGAEKLFTTWLNGNLPVTTEDVISADEPMLKLFGDIQLESLRGEYGHKTNESLAMELVEQNEAWGPLILRRFLTHDQWARFSNSWTKIALEQLAPDGAVQLESVARAYIAEQRQLNEFDIAKLVLEHADRAATKNAAAWAKDRPSTTYPSELDILQLGIETTVENARRTISTELNTRGNPEGSIQIAQQFSLLFHEEPYLTGSLAAGLTQLAGTKKGQEKTTLYNNGLHQAKLAFIWQGSTNNAAKTLAQFPDQFWPEAQRLTDAQQAAVFYQSDFPSPFYTLVGGSKEYLSYELSKCLRYTATGTGCAKQYQSEILKEDNFRNTEEFNAAALAFQSYLAGRFHGAPGYLTLLAEAQELLDGPAGRKSVYATAVSNGSPDWEAYRYLGVWQANEGNFQQAAETFMSFPGFNGADEFENIKLGNNAYDAGSKLYWAGEYEAAADLYMIAAQDESGSNAHMTSAIRLLMLNGEFEAATQVTSARANRYKSKWAYRDLIAMLNVSDQQQNGMALFDAVSNRMAEPEIWTGALAGHRIQGASLDQIGDWLTENGREHMQLGPVNLASRYLFVAGTLDRKPTASLSKSLSKIKASATPQTNSEGWVSVNGTTVGPDVFVISWPMRKDLPNPPKTRLEFAADALASMARGDYDAARKTFESMLQWYRLEEFAPSLAQASVKSSNTATIDKWFASKIDRQSIEVFGSSECTNCRFEVQLTQAILRGHSGQHKESLDLLLRALADRPFTESRAIYTYYQVVETAEFLFADTGYEGYRDFLLDRARRFTRIQPMYSWAYAMVARYSNQEQEQIANLATALYLDPDSWRSSLVDPQLKEKATGWIANNGPLFLPKSTAETTVEL